MPYINFDIFDFSPAVRMASLKEFPNIPFVTIGDGSYICRSYFDSKSDKEHLLIGKYTSIAIDNKFLLGLNHDYHAVTTFPLKYFFHKQSRSDLPDPKKNSNFNNRKQIIIGHDVWIGNGVTILGGARIGNGAVIGAGSVIAKNVPPYSIVVGNPARVIKYRFDSETIRKLQAIRWWDWDLEKIYENYPLLTSDAEIFANKFYDPKLENHSSDDLGDTLRHFKSKGFRIFSAILDCDSSYPLWKKVVTDFSMTNSQDSVLILHSIDDNSIRNLRAVIDFVDNLDFNIIITNFSLDALLETDVLVTTRNFTSMVALDILNSKSIDIRYALDDFIFEVS